MQEACLTTTYLQSQKFITYIKKEISLQEPAEFLMKFYLRQVKKFRQI